jgi:Protein of unknown function (DUF2806)
LALAEAEREAEEIRSGRRKLNDAKYAISLTASESKAEPEVGEVGSSRPVLRLAAESVIADTLRKEVNVAKAVMHAEAELLNDTRSAPENDIDPDWLYRWRDHAGSVSSEQLQAIWGRILAGELKSPGAYSYRLLEFVKNLTKEEANLIEAISPFVITDFVARNQGSFLEKAGIAFGVLLELQDLGILSGAEALGLSKTFKSHSEQKFVNILLCHNKGLLIEHSDPKKTFSVEAYIVTSLGRQVIRLGKFSPNEDYLREIGKQIKNQGFTASLVDWADMGNGMVRYFNRHEITDAQPGAAPNGGPAASVQNSSAPVGPPSVS